MIRGCAIILGTFLRLIPNFLFRFLGYSQIFGYHFFVKFDFFQNNPDCGELSLIFPSMTLRNSACRAVVSMILQFLFLFYYACAKSSISLSAI